MKKHWLICCSLVPRLTWHDLPSGSGNLTTFVVTPQNQYFPANAQRTAIYYLESGLWMHWVIHPPRTRKYPKGGDFAPQGPRDCPRAISRAEGYKILALGKSLGPRGMYFPIHPSSGQCTDTCNINSIVNWQSQEIMESANQCKNQIRCMASLEQHQLHISILYCSASLPFPQIEHQRPHQDSFHLLCN